MRGKTNFQAFREKDYLFPQLDAGRNWHHADDMTAVTVRTVMTVTRVSISPDASLEEAIALMRIKGVDLIPVRDTDEVIGAISDRQIASRIVSDGFDAAGNTVRQVMSPVACSCFDDHSIDEASRLMQQNRVRSMLVFDRQGGFAGVLSSLQMSARNCASAQEPVLRSAAGRTR
jgi:CBS domain-containing protein